jgi:hypothetical protein
MLLHQLDEPTLGTALDDLALTPETGSKQPHLVNYVKMPICFVVKSVNLPVEPLCNIFI